MNRFGKLLRQYRTRCSDPNRPGKGLSQDRLGALMGVVLEDQGYTGSAVSEWERGKSQINKDHRIVLVALLRVLHDCGGLHSLGEADSLLEAGHYRALNAQEIRQISPNWSEDDREPDIAARQILTKLFQELLRRPIATLDRLPSQNESAGAASMDFARLVVTALERLLRPWTSARVLFLAIWVTIWLFVWLSTFTLLDWPPANRSAAQSAGLQYGAGAIITPLFVSVLAYFRDRPFWRSRLPAKSPLIFFILLGALAGFHFAYLTLFALRMATYYLNLVAIPRLLQGVAALWVAGLPYLMARLVPVRFWGVFRRLTWTEGDWALLILLSTFGPFLGLLFPYIYPLLLSPILGLAFTLCAIVLVSASLIWQRHSGKALLPGLFAAVASLFFILQRDSLLEVVIVTGVAITVVVDLVEEKMRATIAGAIIALVAIGMVAILRQYEPFAARLMGSAILIIWVIWGRRHLWFPLSFWIIALAAFGSFYLAATSPWNEAQIAIAFTLVTVMNLALANLGAVQNRMLD